MANQKRRNSLEYIAEKCGISKMSVSRALRNDEGVSEATRELVFRVAQEVNYFPTHSRKVPDKPTRKRYYILFQPYYMGQGTFFNELLLSIQMELFAKGDECSLGTIERDYTEFLRLYKMIDQEDVGGLFIVGDAPIEYLNALLNGFERVVFVDYPGDLRLVKSCNSVYVDHVEGCYKAVEHLLNLGRRRILLIYGDDEHYFTHDMLVGYKTALAHHHIDCAEELLVHGDYTVHGGQQAITTALNNGVQFDAVFSTDIIASGAMNALTSQGITIPRDVSVVGFDGLPLGLATTPPLTTVFADRNRLGRLAVKRMRELDEEKGSESKCVKMSLSPELVIRKSCGANDNTLTPA